MPEPIKIGDRVRLSAAFLRNTGQGRGGEGRKVWAVVACPDCGLCNKGDYVAVNEPSRFALPGEPPNRHFAVGNLKRVGQPDHS